MKKTLQITFMALMAALMCIMGPLSIAIPISPVPISLTNFAIYIALYAIGTWRATGSYLLYLLIGLAGVPVFSAFSGGAGKLFGPTGGYLFGFILMAIICGIFIDKFKNVFLVFLGMILGLIVCYALGTAWLAYQAGMSFSAALAAGVIPFIPGDLAKIIISMILGPQIRKGLRKANLYPEPVKKDTKDTNEQ